MPSPDTSASTSGRSNKANKKAMTIVLKVSTALLSRFPGITKPKVDQEAKAKGSASPSTSSTPVLPSTASVDDASEPRSTPPAADGPSTDPSKKKAGSSPKAGSKRAAGSDTGPKSRARPGPKKKPRLEDGPADSNGRANGSTTTGSHKLGPKANQGAINAGLRALDRTGKPCRKWERKSFQLKSFTGTTWKVPSWRAPPRPKPVDVSMSDAKEAATSGDDNHMNHNKENNASSLVPSERSNVGENDTPSFPGNTESSPAPVSAAA
ncbi:hypothetical protein PRK78_005320 [Emydomyces testavorans]|uniref:INO80 complex, subunit Ies4 n=1 Tax=Emydomyces testavorans TaxID=2070801 RepID=A0AAF0DKA6_9EURO|nr:hypothetical protein PRK78_005320 [Emydomyces testavorans]